MCGITGIIYKDRSRSVDPELLVSMRDCMIYRGPDESGDYLKANLGLAHRRLSIIGLSTGRQPMSNADGTLWITYNGEIYNYLALRKKLESKGYNFRTETDTEVIIHLYAEYGKDCVHHLNGMFAFAIRDERSNSLFLARDRLGVKPLYYADSEEAFVFGSEIKSVLASGCVPTRCNKSAVYEYFLFRAVSGEQTLFDGVRSLLPGHRMLVSDRGIDIEQYWSHVSGERARDIDFTQSVGELGDLLRDAVSIRLMSEVPLGTFCSGGVDSSLVTAIAARAVGRPINTFSVGFYEAEYDETDYARIVSKKYNTNHHEVKVTASEFSDYLPELVRLNDEPLNFSNSVHIYVLSKLARQYVTVVLTGEGADELFLGYPRYQIPRIAGYLRKFGFLVSPLLAMGARVLKDHRFEKIRSYMDVTPENMLLLNAASANTAQLEQILSSHIPLSLDYRSWVLKQAMAREDALAQLSIQDQMTYLVSILNRQDKMSMGASLEARVPFLDYRIAEFANSINSRAKVKGFETKQIVKKVAEEYLPAEVINRRKSGFGVPLAEWFRSKNGLGALAERLINDTEYSEYMDKGAMVRLLSQHQGHLADHSEILWTAVNFLVWKEQYGT